MVGTCAGDGNDKAMLHAAAVRPIRALWATDIMVGSRKDGHSWTVIIQARGMSRAPG